MAEFQGYAQATPYQTGQIASIVPHMKEEQQRHVAAYERYMNMDAANHARNIKAAGNVGKEWQQIGKLSETLNTTFVDMAKRQNEQEMQEGLMQAYVDGIPMDVQQGFNAQEAEMVKTNAELQHAGFQVEQQSGNASAGQQVRDMGGWRGYGYAMGLAQQGGAMYPAYYEQAKATTVVNINGKQVTYDNAANPAERAAVEAQIRRGYLGRFSGMNPVLLNKYLFNQMRSYEAQQMQSWAAGHAARLKSDRAEQQKDEMYAGMESGNAGQSVMNYIEFNKGELGLKGARKGAFDTVEQFLADDNIPYHLREAALQQIRNQEFIRNDGHKTTLGGAYGREMGRLEQALSNAQSETFSRRDQEKRAVQIQYEDKFKAAIAGGAKFTNYEIAQMKLDYSRDTGEPAPQFYDTYVTQEESDVVQEEEILRQKRAARPGGYITSADLDGMSVATRAKYNSQARDGDANFAPSKEVIKKRDRNLRTWTNEKTGSQFGVEDTGTSEWNNMYDNAETAWNTAYAEAIQDGQTPTQAVLSANKAVEDGFNFTNPKIKTEGVTVYNQKPTVSISQAQQREFDESRAFLQANPQGYESQVIPGTEDSLAALKKYRDTGKGDIPHIYKRLSNAYKYLTPYDFANAQLRAAGEPELGSVPKAVELTGTLSPAAQELINFKPTVPRLQRAVAPVSYIAPGNTAVPARGSAQRPTLGQGFSLVLGMGFPERGAAYLAGNIMQESGWYGQRTWGEVMGDGSDRNGGLVSWMDDAQRNHFRLRNIEKYLGKSIRDASTLEQLDAMVWEMKRRNPSAYATFMNPNATDAQLRKASRQYWGYGHEGARYGYARDLLSGNY
jgi:hypothetical protein